MTLIELMSFNSLIPRLNIILTYSFHVITNLNPKKKLYKNWHLNHQMLLGLIIKAMVQNSVVNQKKMLRTNWDLEWLSKVS